MKQSAIKKIWKKFWFILWKDESLKGWILSLLIIFIFIKFIFFPLLSLMTGTTLPLAIVESCSMYHENNMFSNFDNWWDNHEEKYSEFKITKEEFETFKLKRGFNKGDILFITKAKPEKIEIGDIIIFNANHQNPIIHRVIKIEEENGEFTFSTIGDNNKGQLSVEKTISEDQLVGKAIVRLVPYAGWVKLIFYEHSRSESEKGFCEER